MARGSRLWRNWATSFPKKGVVRERNRITNESYDMPKHVWDELRKNTYRTASQLESAIKWRSSWGDEERKQRAIQNLVTGTEGRAGILDIFDMDPSEREALQEALTDLVNQGKEAEFWEMNEWLLRQTYNYYQEFVHGTPEKAEISLYIRDGRAVNYGELGTNIKVRGQAAQPEIVRRLWNALSEFGINEMDYK